MSGASDAVRVEEPLEQEVVLERADVAELEQVADDRPAGRAPGRVGDAGLAGEADEVPDDQEVGGEPHPVDDAQLVLEPVEHLGGGFGAVAVAQALARRARGGRPRGSSRRAAGTAGKWRLPKLEALVVLLDQVGDPRRGGQGLLVAGHRGVHLLGAADVELVGLELHPVRVVDRLAGVDAEQDVVRLGVLAGQVVGVAGGDERAGPSGGPRRRPRRPGRAGSGRRCPGSRRRSSPRRRPSGTRRQSRSASAALPWRRWSENSAETQPERQIRPSECCSRISLSIRGL